jgi:hypothetical protein
MSSEETTLLTVSRLTKSRTFGRQLQDPEAIRIISSVIRWDSFATLQMLSGLEITLTPQATETLVLTVPVMIIG